MRKRTLLFLSVLCALCLSVTAATAVFADEPTTPTEPVAVDFALDETKWTTKTGVACDATDGMHATNNNFNAATVAVGGNSTAKIVLDANLNTTWNRFKVMFKVAEDSAFTWNDHTATISSGNWFAFVLRHDADSIELYECTDGEVAMVASTKVSGFDNWHNYAQKSTITIQTTDTETGVDVNITFVASDSYKSDNTPTGETKTITYSSTNKALWGEGKIAIAQMSGGGVTETNTVKINCEVTDVASDKVSQPIVYPDFAKDESKWLTKDGVAFGTDNMYATTSFYDVATVAVGGNSVVDIKMDANIIKGDWAHLKFMFKVTDSAAYTWKVGETTSTGNWLALVLRTDKNGELFECKDGVVTSCGNTAGDDGNDFWYLNGQITNVNIKTTDTANGVDVVCSYQTGERPSHSVSYSSTNKALWGEGSYVIGRSNGMNITESPDKTVKYNVTVKEKASTYTKDMYYAQNVDSLVSALPETVNADNYSTAKPAYTTAKTAYDALTADQKALLASTTATKLEACGNAVAAYEETLGPSKVMAEIEALPQEITAANYATAKAAIETAQANYNALSDDRKAEVTNKAKLDSAVAALAAYEALVAAVKPVQDLIDALPAEVTGDNYGAAVTAYTAAEKAYRRLSNEQKGYVEDDNLTALATAISTYETADGLYNFATSLDNFKAGRNITGFNFGSNGAALWDVDRAGLVLNQKIGDKQTVYFDFNNNLTGATYGNLYIVFKNKDIGTVYNAGNFPTVFGNYLVLMIAGDGFKIYESVDGEFDATESAGVVTGGVKLPDPGSNGTQGNNNDVWHWYKQFTRVSIYTEDVDDGVDITISLTGGNSGKTFTTTHHSDNTKLHGDSYVSVEYFLGAAGSGENGNVILRSAKVSGVTSSPKQNYDIDALNVEVTAKAATVVTSANVEEMKTYLGEITAKYDSMNYAQREAFAVAQIEILKTHIETYEAEIVIATALDTAIEALPASVDKTNYATAKTAINAAKATYDGLPEAGKLLVTKTAKLNSAVAALTAYETDLQKANDVDALIEAIPEISKDNYEEAKTAVEAAENAYNALTAAQKELVTKHDDLTAARTNLDANKPKKGCKGVMAFETVAAMAILLAAGVFVAVKRKKA